MSKSYQKNPVCGNTCARSEKEDKRRSHRRARVLARDFIAEILCRGPEIFSQEIPPEKKEFPGLSRFAKDGKQWLSREFLTAGLETGVVSRPRVLHGKLLK